MRRLFRLPLRSPASTQADADEELSSFIDARVADLVAHGMPEFDARADTLHRLGGSLIDVRQRLRTSAARREHRMQVREWLETIAQDLRFGARQLAKAPGVAAIAVFTLAIGIGANAAIFAMIDAVLLRTLPVERPNELVAVGKTTAIEGHTTGAPRGDLLSLPMYRALQQDQHLVTGLAASGTARRLDVRIASTGDDEHPNGRFVSGNFFAVLGISAERGRLFDATRGDDVGGSPVVVVSDSYWHSRFGGAPDIVGQRIDVDGAALTIIGVAQGGFDGDVVDRPTQLWMPISIQPLVQPHTAPIDDPGTCWLLLLGRLAPGVTLDAARAGFTTRVRALLVASATSAGEAAHLRRAPIIVSSGAQGFSAARVNFRTALVTLQTAVALLLLIVCTNIANLLVGRALARQTEMSVRLALGAGRRRLIRQLMTESVLMAVAGAAAGAALAWWGSGLLGRVATTTDSPVGIAGSIDVRVLGFSLGVCVLAVVGFGLAPALLASRADLASSMRAHARSVIARGGRRGVRVPIGAALVPLQVALCLVLLTGAALLARSLTRLESQNTGLDRDHLLIAEVDASREGLKGQRFMTEATELSARIAAIPGVRSATYSQSGIFLGHGSDAVVAVPGFVGRTVEDSTLTYDLVGPGYLGAIGAQLLRGRDVDAHDAGKTPSVAVLNESAARFLFHDGNSIGKVIYFDAGVPTTVVGVVADVRDHTLTGPVERRAYVPYAQEISDDDTPFLAFAIRTHGDPATVVQEVRRTIAQVDPSLPVVTVTPLHALMRNTIRAQQLVTTLATAFGFAALVLALVGLYGVMSYAVTRRTAELGLRSALGADRGDVLRLVLGDGLRLAGLGLLVGVPLALVASRALGTQVHGLPSADAATLGVAAGGIAVCAFIAALVPAVRASRVSPVSALAQD